MARHAALETFGRSGNPVFGDKFNQSQGFVGSERMTLDGTVNKTGILLGLCFLGAIISWNIPNPLLMAGACLPTSVNNCNEHSISNKKYDTQSTTEDTIKLTKCWCGTQVQKSRRHPICRLRAERQ